MYKIAAELWLYKSLIETGDMSQALNRMIEDLKSLVSSFLSGSELSKIDFSKKLTDNEHRAVLSAIDRFIA